ncbi:hypothetical protein GPECTOR_10g937 [Gonium pectorale]|uniref:Uncharacterized protein n=1 Tax=Gonium pectorale TaxID=33097 RepID=A0A150GR44_GONPE|nr:hypothetical protein GPECTOR_10g937 [Gonium pectorale]|eukprot:KXZ52305.1 hypothetical protein GPECTOR_10g937 [Gonium pectorale]
MGGDGILHFLQKAQEPLGFVCARVAQGFRAGSLMAAGATCAAVPAMAFLRRAPAVKPSTLLTTVGCTALAGAAAAGIYDHYYGLPERLSALLQSPQEQAAARLGSPQGHAANPPFPSIAFLGGAAGMLATAAAPFARGFTPSYGAVLLGGTAAGCAAGLVLGATAPGLAEDVRSQAVKLWDASTAASAAAAPYAYRGLQAGSVLGLAAARVMYGPGKMAAFGRSALQGGLLGAAAAGAFGPHRYKAYTENPPAAEANTTNYGSIVRGHAFRLPAPKDLLWDTVMSGGMATAWWWAGSGSAAILKAGPARWLQLAALGFGMAAVVCGAEALTAKGSQKIVHLTVHARDSVRAYAAYQLSGADPAAQRELADRLQQRERERSPQEQQKAVGDSNADMLGALAHWCVLAPQLLTALQEPMTAASALVLSNNMIAILGAVLALQWMVGAARTGRWSAGVLPAPLCVAAVAAAKPQQPAVPRQ